jgi:hypothetical protein
MSVTSTVRSSNVRSSRAALSEFPDGGLPGVLRRAGRVGRCGGLAGWGPRDLVRHCRLPAKASPSPMATARSNWTKVSRSGQGGDNNVRGETRMIGHVRAPVGSVKRRFTPVVQRRCT